jgi:septum formation topological specificity factor MinE
MIEQEQVQVTQADRDAAEALRGSPAYALGFYDHTPLVQAFARHRHTATSEALEAMREAREALEVVWNNVSLDNVCVPMVSKAHARLTAAIAKIEGEQP